MFVLLITAMVVAVLVWPLAIAFYWLSQPVGSVQSPIRVIVLGWPAIILGILSAATVLTVSALTHPEWWQDGLMWFCALGGAIAYGIAITVRASVQRSPQR